MTPNRHTFSSRERSALFRSSRDAVHNVLYVGDPKGNPTYDTFSRWLPENFRLLLKPPMLVESLAIEDAYLCAFVEMEIKLEQPEVIEQLKLKYPWLPIVLCMEIPSRPTVLAGLRAGVQECFVRQGASPADLMHTIYCAVERKHAERLWARNRQLDQLSPLEQLAGGLAHELNNPIGWIGANMEFMAEAIEQMHQGVDVPGARRELAELLMECRQGIDRINGIVRAVRDFAQTSKKSMDLLEIEHVLEQAVKLANGQIKRTAQVIMECEPGLPLIQGDRRALMDALMHLLLNAVEAIREHPPGDWDQTIGLFARLDGQQIEVRVVDTGVGASEHVIQHAMEPFFTTRSSRVGLGLSIVQDIVETHQGTLAFEAAQLPWATAVVMRLPIWQELPTLSSISQEYSPIERCEWLVLERTPELFPLCEQLFKGRQIVAVNSVDKALWGITQSKRLVGVVIGMDEVDRFIDDLRWSLEHHDKQLGMLVCAPRSEALEALVATSPRYKISPVPFREHFVHIKAMLLELFGQS